ncbi:MAG: acyltransferase family protein [Blastocatellia bacterium]
MNKTELSIGSGRLRSIDALRGIAALAVLLFHAGGGFAGRFNVLPPVLATSLSTLLSFGYTGVGLFFVISGFCIHLRWAKARAAGHSPQTDFIAFWKRRIFRLYPPYLIALGCYLFVLMLEGKLAMTPFFGFDIGVHLLMMHNVLFDTAYSFNGPFWTLAIEEQLYLAYFLLLFLRRRLGWAWTLGICLTVRILWFALAQGVNPLLASLFGQPFYYQSHSFGVQMPINEGALFHWIVWALGAFAVEGAVGLVTMPAWCRSLRLGLVTLTAAAALAYVDRTASATGLFHYAAWLVIDPLWGLGFFCIVNAAVAREHRWRLTGRLPRLIALLAGVGIFSYSLYLMHEFVLAHFLRMTSSWFGVPESGLTIFSLLALAPVCVALAWAFFQLFERPFIPKPAAPPSQLTPATARTRRQRKAALILRRAAIVGLALFVLAEVGLRVYDRIRPLAIFLDDSYNRFRGRPFAPDYNFRLNSRGFKDVEFRQQKEEGSRRILAIGGSSAYAAPPYQHAYPTVLEQRLNQSGGHVEVVNMAIPNLRPNDYFSLLVREGLALQPDLVVVSFSMGSDLEDDNLEPHMNSYVAATLRSLKQTPRRYEGLIYNGAPAYEDNQPTMPDADYLQTLQARSRVYSKPNDALIADIAEATSQLARMKRLCDANGIGFTVVLIPDEVQVDGALQAQFGGRDFARPSRLLAEQLSAQQIDCVDLLDEFTRASGQRRLYKPNDGRWNIAGNRLAAELLERHLSARLPGALRGGD